MKHVKSYMIQPPLGRDVLALEGQAAPGHVLTLALLGLFVLAVWVCAIVGAPVVWRWLLHLLG